MDKAYLVLSDGSVFEGRRIGAKKDAAGEIVFKTDVVGYLEALTAPEFTGKILLQTFPLIGNYGVIPEDISGNCAVAGYVVRELCDTPSNFRSEYPLEKFLEDNGVPGICGVDTRAITKLICKHPGLTAKICRSIDGGGADNA